MLRFSSYAFLLFFCLSSFTFGETRSYAGLTLHDRQGSYDLSAYKYMYVDHDRKQSVQEIAAKRNLFQKESNNNFGFTSSNYWFYFQIKNEGTAQEWMLELAYALNDEAILYQLDEVDEWQATPLGERYPKSEWKVEFRHPVFPIKLSQGQEATFLLKVNNIGTVELPLTLWKQQGFTEYILSDNLIFGIYFGSIIAISAFNLFLFLSLGDRTYLYFVFSTFGYIFFSLCSIGMGFQYFWGESIWFANRSIVLSICFSSIATLQFTRSFLLMKGHMPRLDRFFQALMTCNLVVAAWAVISLSLWTTIAVTLLVFPLTIGFWIAGVLSWKKGYEPAKYYVLAWAMLTVGAMIHALKALTILPMVRWTDSAFMIGAAFNVVLFSFGLAERFNLYRKGALQAKEELLSQERQYSERLEIKVQERTQELEESNQQLTALNQEKNHFLNIAAHDLKSPLANLGAFAEMASQALPEGETTVREHLQLMQQSAKNMSGLVGNLLDIDRIEAQVEGVDLEKIDLNRICHETVEPYQVQAKKRGMVFQFDLPTEPIFAMADPQWAGQVVGNLVSNAMKFSPDQTSITISIHDGDGRARLAVADQGPGIRPMERLKLFTKFGRLNNGTQNNEKSTGLGLHSVKLMMLRMEGEVYLDETYSKGAKFVLEFKEV